MILVGDIFDNSKEILGSCSDEAVYNRLNEAVTMLGNLGLWNPLVGFMDICTQACEITLPDDVEVPLAVNVGGVPCDFRNKWYEFHLNGPGSECCGQVATWAWTDEGMFPTFRTIHRASTLMATPDTTEHAGAHFRVYGYDQNDKWIMTPTCDSGGALVDGFDVPIVYPYSSPTSIKVKRILRVSKPVTVGFVGLSALDPGSSTGSTLLGYYRPSDTEPQFRRISVAGCGCDRLFDCWKTNSWVRMRFRKKFFKINSLKDQIFLNSPTAVYMGLKAMKKYRDDLPEEYAKYMKLAREALNDAQKSQNGPNQIRMQFQRSGYASRAGENMN